METIKNLQVYGLENAIRVSKFPMSVDASKCTSEEIPRTQVLFSAERGSGHDNALKGIIVQFDWTYTVKLSPEAERYHWFDIISSQSTMHRITKFDLDKAYIGYVDKRCIEVMKEKVKEYNDLIEYKNKCDADTEERKRIVELANEKYLEILYTNPCGMMLTVGITTNYQQLKTIYYQRKDHRLPEWREFCKWIEELPRFKELVLDIE